jgi:hypothetical protein
VASAASAAIAHTVSASCGIDNFTNVAPTFPFFLTGPYKELNQGWYPNEKDEYDLNVTADGKAVALTWFWSEGFRSVHAFEEEQSITQTAANKVHDLIAVQNQLFCYVRNYHLGAAVIPTKPHVAHYKTEDGTFYIQTELVVKEPPRNLVPKVVHKLAPSKDANGKLVRKKLK